LKKEAKFVNGFLKQLCISNFEIHITSDKEENIEIIYHGGRTKKGIRYTLSEGEKTTLAFAYFLSKIKYEIIENTAENLNEYIIVIDDPVSSLDENRLFSTALVIRDYFSSTSKQLIVLSHNLVFLKFLGNIVDKSPDERADLMIEDGKIKKLPVSLTNYQTSYFYKLIKIQDFLDGSIEYENAKDFLPNSIRTVLETFLAFKFCRLKNGSSRQKYHSPGLDKLISTLDGINFSGYEKHGSISSKDDLKKVLQEIKNKVDPESHGTPQDLSEFEFMSEKELKILAFQTIEAIGYLDQLHLTEVKK
jgi:wobble nucleotide-excising tRNase